LIDQNGREFHHLFPQRHKYAITRLYINDGAPGEAAKGRKDKRVVAEKETRQPQGSALAIRDFHDRVPVPGYMEAPSIGVPGIMDHSEIIGHVQMGHTAELGGERWDFSVVISSYQDDGNSKTVHEIGQRCLQLRRDAGGTVKEVTRNDELGGFGFFGQIKKAA